MSRRATPGQAAQNQQTIKSLLKLEPNKVCADCKRNKHPRWASWNLGIFVCIRCSGIHRGMGTHISRVKSVDLDAWTDEQVQSVLKWGNGRANKYWEAKLAPGHVPSDAKIENFIRTKYEAKRWVMEGGIPDPSTLSEGDDDVLSRKKRRLNAPPPSELLLPPQPKRQQAPIDLFADDDMMAAPPRPSTTEPSTRAPPPPRQAQPTQHKAQKTGDSLLGLDFFGSAQPPAGSRPTSTSSTPAAPSGMSRPDLKQSILSLYSKPQPASVQHERNNSFGDMASPQSTSSSNMGAKPAEKPSPFANLTNFGSAKSTPAAPKVTSPAGSASGDLFASLTSPTMSATKPQSRTTSISSNSQDFGFGGFSSPPPQPKPNPPSSSLSNDLWGFSSPPVAPAVPPKPIVSSPQQEMSSAFNISSPPVRSPPPQQAQKPAVPAAAAGMMDPWGGNAWSNPEPASAPAPAPAASSGASMMKVPDTLTANDIGSGWGAPPPKPAPAVAADEDFGGWTSASPITPATTTNNSSTKPAGGFGGGSDDLFSNVWE
ncbi:Arf GTPase activating protein [Penicillium manginii]|uniref:Arf GTPase activating protein n=1 Tax=Penicillium manginii TaxID=203109 RepID=UPI0025465850|nr:Arf GTPase activating protein [Penicillium manginii]KAJ5755700.1 Arf GTPase activating protein [Penicillium manginii]